MANKKWVYNYANVCYKASTQRVCYINNIHSIKTHDMVIVDDRTGPMIDGDALDDEFNHGILPLINPPK